MRNSDGSSIVIVPIGIFIYHSYYYCIVFVIVSASNFVKYIFLHIIIFETVIDYFISNHTICRTFHFYFNSAICNIDTIILITTTCYSSDSSNK